MEMKTNSPKEIYSQLRKKYRNILEKAIRNYDHIYQENLIFMAEVQAGIYVKVNSVNEDSPWEMEDRKLKQKLINAEEDLKNVISVYEMISRDENKIINDLSPSVGNANNRMKSIINSIETGEFALI